MDCKQNVLFTIQNISKAMNDLKRLAQLAGMFLIDQLMGTDEESLLQGIITLFLTFRYDWIESR